jgi:hypothetical protein
VAPAVEKATEAARKAAEDAEQEQGAKGLEAEGEPTEAVGGDTKASEPEAQQDAGEASEPIPAIPGQEEAPSSESMIEAAPVVDNPNLRTWADATGKYPQAVAQLAGSFR